MTAGEKYEYLWADGKTIKKAIPCSAPKYTDYLMTWVENQIDCEDIFPKTPGIYNFFTTIFSFSFFFYFILYFIPSFLFTLFYLPKSISK